ncbi:MAG: hypothetical protein ACOC1O_04205 [bacterium]
METNAHYALKFKALQWLYQKGCKHIALELKYGKYIFDVVGTDGHSIYIIEAKQAKEDFLRECNKPEELKENIQEYKNLLISTGDKKYKELLEKEREKSWKFYDPMFLRLANERYIIAPDGLVDDELVPENWGLINEEPRQIIKSNRTQIDKSYIVKIIQEISKKNTKMYMKSIGVDFDAKNPIFPNWELYL